MKAFKIIIVVLLIALTISVLPSCSIIDSLVVSNEIVAECGEFTVSECMMSFFVNDYIANWEYITHYIYGLLSLDLKEDIKTQKINFGDLAYLGDDELLGMTWYDYFVSKTLQDVEKYLIYANAGNDIDDCRLNDADYDVIDDMLASTKERLSKNDSSLSRQYGKGVNESIVRSCYELLFRAYKYEEYIDKTKRKEFKNNDIEIQRFLSDSQEELMFAKTLSFSLAVYKTDISSNEKYDNAVANAKTAANIIAKAETPAEFINYVFQYKESSGSFVNSDIKIDEKYINLSEELVEKCAGKVYYQTETKLGKWIFENNAEINDILIAEELDTMEVQGDNMVYERYSVDVTMLVEKPQIDDTLTHNIAYFITDDKEAAEDFIDQFSNAKEKNRDTFMHLAERKQGSVLNVDHHATDNRITIEYESIDHAQDGLFNYEFDVLNNWIEDPLRSDGDYSVVPFQIDTQTTNEFINADTNRSSDGEIYRYIQYDSGIGYMGGNQYFLHANASNVWNGKTTYYAIIYFEGHGKAVSYIDAFETVLKNSIDNLYENELKKNPVIFQTDLINKVEIVCQVSHTDILNTKIYN